MGRVASAGDNAAMESWHALLQKNVLDRRRWRTREELHQAVVFWIEHTYNRRRRQRGLGKLTPVEYELAFTSRGRRMITPNRRQPNLQQSRTRPEDTARRPAPSLLFAQGPRRPGPDYSRGFACARLDHGREPSPGGRSEPSERPHSSKLGRRTSRTAPRTARVYTLVPRPPDACPGPSKRLPPPQFSLETARGCPRSDRASSRCFVSLLVSPLTASGRTPTRCRAQPLPGRRPWTASSAR